MAAVGTGGPTGGGNTRNPPRRVSAAKRWVFTFNNPSAEDLENLLLKLEDISLVKQYIFQDEVAPSTGTPHLQGCVMFQKRIRPKSKFSRKIHWEICRDWDKAVEYCSDPDKRAPGGNCYYNVPPPRKLQLITELRPWQQEVVDIVNDIPHDRHIYWYWGPPGCGKTALIKYLVARKGAVMVGGKSRHAKSMFHKYPSNCYICSLSYADKAYCSYRAIEEIKDGLVFSAFGTDATGFRLQAPPHVFVFANYEPRPEQIHPTKLIVRRINPTDGGGGVAELGESLFYIITLKP